MSDPEREREELLTGDPLVLYELYRQAAAQRNDAHRFIAALAADGPLTVTERALVDVPHHPEFVRWQDPVTGTVRVRLANGKPKGRSVTNEGEA